MDGSKWCRGVEGCWFSLFSDSRYLDISEKVFLTTVSTMVFPETKPFYLYRTTALSTPAMLSRIGFVNACATSTQISRSQPIWERVGGHVKMQPYRSREWGLASIGALELGFGSRARKHILKLNIVLLSYFSFDHDGIWQESLGNKIAMMRVSSTCHINRPAMPSTCFLTIDTTLEKV